MAVMPLCSFAIGWSTCTISLGRIFFSLTTLVMKVSASGRCIDSRRVNATPSFIALAAGTALMNFSPTGRMAISFAAKSVVNASTASIWVRSVCARKLILTFGNVAGRMSVRPTSSAKKLSA